MSAMYERIYIRFKGRVLGPLPHQKVVELVARRQITRDQEMSSDGVHWMKASEFTVFFPVALPQAVDAHEEGELRAKMPAASPVAWYVGFDGETPRAYDERTIKDWIATGKIASETLIWKPDMEAWQEAGLVRPQWFLTAAAEGGKSDAAGGASYDGATTWETVSEELAASKPWVIMLAVTGLVTSIFGLIAFTVCFFLAIIGSYSAVFKLCAVLAALSQIIMCLAGIWLCTRLMQYSSLLTAVGYRGEPDAVRAALKCVSGVWRLGSLVVLIWVVVSTLGALFTLFAWGAEPPGDESYSNIRRTPDSGYGKCSVGPSELESG